MQIISDPNINLLGKHKPSIYGSVTLEECLGELRKKYPDMGLDYFQSSVEGKMIDRIQQTSFGVGEIALSAGVYAHTPIALQGAIRSVPSPAVEVHISNVHTRESFRHVSMITRACENMICGFGLNLYRPTLKALLDKQV